MVKGICMYRCLCGAVFEEPLKVKETINHGEGFFEHGFCLLCPSCGCEEPYFEEIEEGEEMGDQLIQVVQLPVIEEQLRTLKARWEQRALDAESMVCTADTIQTVKAFRAEMRKEFDEVETLRKRAKQAVMEPYNQFESVYKECVTTAFQRADRACSSKVSEVEEDMKRRCEDGLREYFDELCAARHLDWLTYERAGIKVDMASAKAKTPKKLREQLEAFVDGVNTGVDIINSMDYSAEIMLEFKKHLDTTRAICDVAERHRRIEEQKSAQEARKAEQECEAKMVRRVEALAPPVKANEKDPNEIISRLTFTCINATRAQLRRVRDFLNMEGIRYE